jgi:hypothetical protein
MRAFRVFRGTHASGLQFELGNVLIDHHEVLLGELHAVWQT